jgi:hypothetical protein
MSFFQGIPRQARDDRLLRQPLAFGLLTVKLAFELFLQLLYSLQKNVLFQFRKQE